MKKENFIVKKTNQLRVKHIKTLQKLVLCVSIKYSFYTIRRIGV